MFHPTRSRASAARAAIALLLVALTAACGATTRRVDPDYDFAAITSFAWREPPRLAAATAAGDDDVEARVERAVQRGLERRGIRLVDKAEADVVLSATLQVEVRQHANDPNFALWRTEQFEEGTLSLEMFDRAARRSVWLAEARLRLRTTGRTMGGMLPRTTAVEEPRNWQVDDLVARVLDELPRDPQ